MINHRILTMNEMDDLSCSERLRMIEEYDLEVQASIIAKELEISAYITD